MFEFPQPAFRPRRPELRCPLAGTPPIRPRQPCRFRVLAFTLAAFLPASLSPGAVAALHERIDDAREEYRAITEEDVRDARRAGERLFAADSQEGWLAWRAYLLWDEQQQHLEGDGPIDGPFWNQVLRRLAANWPGLELDCFASLRGTIRDLIDLAEIQRQPHPQAHYLALLDELAALLPGDSHPPSAVELEELSGILSRLGQSRQTPDLVAAVREEFLFPNLFVGLPASLVAAELNQPIRQPYDYHRLVGAASVTASGTIEATLTATLPESAKPGVVQLQIDGVSAAESTSREEGVRVRTRSDLQFSANASLHPTREGFQVEPFQATGRLDSRIIGVSSGYRGRRASEANQRARAQHAARLPLAESLALRDLGGHLTQQLGERCRILNAAIDEHVRNPLLRYDRFPAEVTFENARSTLWLMATMADEHQLAGPPAPDFGDPDTVRLFCHQSSLNNNAGPIFASRTWSFQELLGLWLSDVPQNDPLAITFAPLAPVFVGCADNEISLRILAEAFEYEGRRYSGMEIQVRFGLEHTDHGWQFLRRDKPQVLPRLLDDGSRPQLKLRDLAFRRILLNRLERDIPERIDAGAIRLPEGFERVRTLEAVEAEIRDGWLLMSFQMPATDR